GDLCLILRSTVMRMRVSGILTKQASCQEEPMANPCRSNAALRLFFCLGLAVVFGSQPTYAQVLYGTLVGNVKDASGAAAPGATVTIVNTSTNVSRETITNETGTYTLSNILPGAYTLKVTLTGFKEFTQT